MFVEHVYVPSSLIFIYSFIIFRERAQASEGQRERENPTRDKEGRRERERRGAHLKEGLCSPNEGLELTNHEILT